jgi:hypothetical protein
LPAQCRTSQLATELFTGTAWSVPLPLLIDVAEGGRSRIIAHYSTRPFVDAPYYSYRISHTQANGRAVEAEMLHHKLYLENPGPPLDHFEATHGYNLPTINVANPVRRWQLRVGIGLVVVHPEGRIRGHEISGGRTLLGGGYHIAGLTAQLAAGRRYSLGSGRVALTAAPEAKLTASWARIRVDQSTLHVPNIALHLLGGIGVRRCS